MVHVLTLSGSVTFCGMDQKSVLVVSGSSIESDCGKNLGPFRFLCTSIVTVAVLLRSGLSVP